MSRQPQPIANVLAELMARRGYGRVDSSQRSARAWREAVGESLGPRTRAGRLSRGVLEIMCSSSTLVQEMAFQKSALLAKLAELLPDEKIRDLRFRVGPID